MFKRMIWLLALSAMLFSAPGRLFASEEAGEPKPGLLPPLSGEGSMQTLYAAVWVLVIFIVLLAVLYPTAWRSVLAGLKKREERIRNDIADAEAARAKAEDLLKQYNEQLAAAEARSREMIAAATTQGEKLATQIRMTAQQESEETKERALRDIEAAKVNAVREVREEAANLSVMIAEKIIRRNLNAQDQQDLIRESLEQFHAVGN